MMVVCLRVVARLAFQNHVGPRQIVSELTTTRLGNRARISPKEGNPVYDALYVVAQNRNSRSNTVAAGEMHVKFFPY
jgi:hypothetical protein